MRYAPTQYDIPAAPPDEVLAELDAAAGVLGELSDRGTELTLQLDDLTGGLRIELANGDGSRALTPTQLFELLGSPSL